MPEPIITTDDKGVLRAKILTFDEFRENGLLWHINRAAFHPLGMALALGGGDEFAQVWGNRDEPWTMPEEVDNEKFAKVWALFDRLRA